MSSSTLQSSKSSLVVFVLTFVVLGAQVTRQADQDLFDIRVKQVLKSPTNATAATTVEHVRLLGYSCCCHRLQVNSTYIFPGTLSEEGNILEVNLRMYNFWDMDDSAPQQKCS